MKKIVFILLILVILNDFASAGKLKDEWDKIKNAYQKAKNWLIEKDLWDPLVNAIKSGGKALGNKICNDKAHDVEFCKDAVNWLIDHLKL